MILLVCFCACRKEFSQKELRVSRVYPACGPQGVATHLTVYGAGLTSGDTVLLGRTPGTQVQAVSEKELRVLAPPLPVGSVPITVIGRSGARRTIISAYRYCDAGTFDPNGDCEVDAADIFYLNRYLARKGPAPILSGDANGDGVVDKQDVDWLIAYLFTNGPSPRTSAAAAQQGSASRPGR